jgi:hypothetical protein
MIKASSICGMATHREGASKDRVSRLLTGWELLPAVEPFDFAIESAARTIALEIRHNPVSLDSATIRRLFTIAASVASGTGRSQHVPDDLVREAP